MGGEGKQACICYFESGGTYTPVNSAHSLDNAIIYETKVKLKGLGALCLKTVWDNWCGNLSYQCIAGWVNTRLR